MLPLSQKGASHREMLGITSRTSSKKVYGHQTFETGIQHDGEGGNRREKSITQTSLVRRFWQFSPFLRLQRPFRMDRSSQRPHFDYYGRWAYAWHSLW